MKKHKDGEYFYSEGYIYQNTDTICELFGTESEKQETAKHIVHMHNNWDELKNHFINTQAHLEFLLARDGRVEAEKDLFKVMANSNADLLKKLEQ